MKNSKSLNVKKWFFLTLTLLIGLTMTSYAQVTFTGVSQTQTNIGVNQPYGQGTVYQRLLRVDVATGGSGTPLNIAQLNLSLVGYEAIERLTVIRGESSNQAAIDLMMTPYAVVENPGASETITLTNANITSGTTTRIFVAIDLKQDAAIGTVLDATGVSLVANGNTHTIGAVGTDRSAVVVAPYSGVKVVGVDTGFSTARESFVTLNDYGIGDGGLHLVFKDDEIYAPVGGTIVPFTGFFRQKTTAASPLIIRRSGDGVNRPVVQVNASGGTTDHVLAFTAADYVTIDGLEVRCSQNENNGNGLEYGFYFLGTFNDGCTNNIIRNCVIDLKNPSRGQTYGISFFSRAQFPEGVNSNNKIYNNVIKNADTGVNFNNHQSPATYNCDKTEIYNNHISGFCGSAYGAISLRKVIDVDIYNNTIDGAGVSHAASTVRGIQLIEGTGVVRTYNNTIRNLTNTRTGNSGVEGISILAPTVYLYNNMVSNLKTTAATGSSTIGISLPSNNSIAPNYYLWHNSVYLDMETPAGHSTAALHINGNQSFAIESMKNNIFVNTSIGGTANRVLYSQHRASGLLKATEVDNNLYYPEGTGFIHYQNVQFNTFDSYKASTVANFDKNAVSELPPFASIEDLHIQPGTATIVEGNGTPVPQVTTDIDGESRHASLPDIGADEGNFSPINLAPVMNAVTDVGPINNDIGEQTIELTGISDGNPTAVQNLTITAVSSNTDVIPNPVINYTQGNETGILNFTPTGVGRGEVTITITVKDDGGTERGGVDTSVYTFVVHVIDPALNNPPTIHPVEDQIILDNIGSYTVQLSNITDGDPFKVQNLTVTASAFPEGIISVPVVNYTSDETTGSLTFSPVGVGSTVVTVTVKDDGGDEGESENIKTISFMVTVRNFESFAFIDKFDDGVHTWWNNNQYTIVEREGNLVVTGRKNQRWATIGVNLPQAIDITDAPYMYIRLKPQAANMPFKIFPYLADGTANANLSGRVLWSDDEYTELFFDFTDKTNINKSAITQIYIAINGDALSWNGTVLIDEIRIGSNVRKAANIAALPDVELVKGSTQNKVFITDVEHATSLSISGAENLIQNATFTPLQGGISTLSFDVKSGVSGREQVTVTANGAPGYDNKPVKFWVNVETNLPPTINQTTSIDVEVGKEIEVRLTGISDGNIAAVQPLTITAQANNTTSIPAVSVDYIQEQTVAGLKFTPVAAGKDVVITVTVDDGEAQDNIKEMSFNVNVYADLNYAPTTNRVTDVDFLFSGGAREIIITGVSDGDDETQNIAISATTAIPGIISSNASDVVYTPGSSEIRILVTPLSIGSTVYTLTLADNGGTPENNGDMSTEISFTINVLDDPIYGYTIPTDKYAEERAAGLWGFGNMFNMSRVDFDGHTDVIRVNFNNKTNWDGFIYNFPKEINVTDHPYMSMEVYPISGDLQWHAYYYDYAGKRNADGAHAQRKTLTANQWNTVFLDYRNPDYLLDGEGNPINTNRIDYILFNVHDKFVWPNNILTGSFYMRNIRFGNHTVVPNMVTLPTLNKMYDRAHLLNLTPAQETVTLSGISDGNFSTDGLIISVSSSDPSIVNPQVSPISPAGTATLTYTPGTITGNAVVTVSIQSATATLNETFNVTIADSNPTAANQLTVDANTTYQKIHGFGTFLPSSRHVDLYTDELGATVVRLGFIDNQFELANDNNDPYVINMAGFNRNVFNWDQLRTLRDGGVKNFILSSWSPPAWMKGNLSLNWMQAGAQVNSDNTDNKLQYHYYEEFAEMMVAFCRVFKEEMGIELRGIGLQNEPVFHEPYPSAILDIQRYVELHRVVGARFEYEGITETELFMPEQVFSQNANSMAAYMTAINNDPIANKYSPVFATHGYASDGVGAGTPNFTAWENMWNTANAGSLPKELWMTETYKDWTGNFVADAMFMANAIYGSLTAGNVSLWAFWSFDSGFFDKISNSPTPLLYVHANYARFIKPGAKRIGSTFAAANQHVLGASFLNSEEYGNTMATILINNSAEPQTVVLNGENLPSQFEIYQTAEGVNLKKMATTLAGGVILLPGHSISTVVGSYGNQPPTINPVENITLLHSAPTEQTVILTGISDGELGLDQQLTFTVTSSNTAVVTQPTVEYTQGTETATLRFTHLRNPGNADITITLKDDGGTDGGSVDAVQISFRVIINEDINHLPTVNPIAAREYLEDQQGLSIDLTGISDGDQFTQNLTIEASVDNEELITNLELEYTYPATTGTIRYELGKNVNGLAIITLKLSDDGGNEFNNGNQVKVVEIPVTVIAVNDPPTIDDIPDMEFTTEKVERTIRLTGISDGDPELEQTLLVTISALQRSRYFESLDIAYEQGSSEATITFVPAGAVGSSRVTVRLDDGGGSDHGGAAVTTKVFNITFIPHSSVKRTEHNFRLYPNPAKDFVKVEIPAATMTSYSIYSANGGLIKTGKVASDVSALEIDVAKLSRGVYTLILQDTENQRYSLPLILE